MRKVFIVVILVLGFSRSNYAQQNDVEVFVIDSYITQEEPYTFVLSLFTSEKTTCSVTIEDKYTFVVSDTLSEDHSTEIDISNYQFDSSYVKYFLSGIDSNGDKFKSTYFEVTLPSENLLVAKSNTSLLTVCCLGGVIFGLPSPTVVFNGNETKFSLVKEIPLFSFYSGGYNYPAGYVSIEYAHIFDSEFNNYVRLGYKHIFEIKPIQFVSAGVSGFTTFEGFNGFSPEITIGWFQISNYLTVYSRYRFNFQPSASERNFHEISLGIFSNIFSLNL